MSNSSSSSFVITGICIDTDIDGAPTEEVIDLFKPEIAEKLKEGYFDEVLYSYDKDLIVCRDEDDTCFVGVEPSFADDSKTIGQLKQEAIDALSKVLKAPPKLSRVGIFYGASYDG